MSGNCVVMGEKEKDYQVPLVESSLQFSHSTFSAQVLVDMYSMSRVGWNKWSMFKYDTV